MKNEEMLSQDQIDALLKSNQDTLNETNPISANDFLDERAINAICEIGNISLGSSATALSALMGQEVKIIASDVTVVKSKSISGSIFHPSLAVRVHYTRGIEGSNWLIFKRSDASVIADLMSGGDGNFRSDDITGLQLNALQQAMNQMMGASAASIASILNHRAENSPPLVEMLEWKEEREIESLLERPLFIQISYNLRVNNLIDSSIVQLIPLEFGQFLINQLLLRDEPYENSLPVFEEKSETKAQRKIPKTTMKQRDLPGQEPFGQDIKSNASRSDSQSVNVQPAIFASFEQPDFTASESKNLAMLLDIPLQITVELGRTQRTVQEILALSSGSVIELDKLAGEPVDVLVNSRLIAKGEVVVIEENFGVRLTDIISQNDRLNKLR